MTPWFSSLGADLDGGGHVMDQPKDVFWKAS